MRTGWHETSLVIGLAAALCSCAGGGKSSPDPVAAGLLGIAAPRSGEKPRAEANRQTAQVREEAERARMQEEVSRRDTELSERSAQAETRERDALAAEQSGRAREALKQYLAGLAALGADGPAEIDSRLRERVIRLAARLTPPPAIPELAERQMLYGQIAVKQAKAPADYRIAAEEFQKAVNAAPWWAEAYFNLAVVQERAGLEEQAARNYKWYLRAAPDAKDAKDVQLKIAEIEYGQQLKKRRMQEWVGSWTSVSKLVSRSECRRSGPMEYGSNAFDFRMNVLAVSDSGEATVELIVPEIGWQAGSERKASASASSLTITGKEGERIELSRDGNQTFARVSHIYEFRHNYPLGPPLICKYNYELNAPITRR